MAGWVPCNAMMHGEEAWSLFSASDYVLREIPVLTLSGDVDLAAATEFRERVDLLLDRGASLVVVDLTATDFFDSAGLKVLDEAQRDAGMRGARLALACPPGRVLRLFEITGLDDRFEIHLSAEHAVADGRD